ncbi:MAG: hypothetical protein GY778_20040 [bacterium]|nr:hypothetical protein [bacterium]
MRAGVEFFLCRPTPGSGVEIAPDAADRRPELVSLLGSPLYALPPGVDVKQVKLFQEARTALAANPDDPERIVWVGRRLAYLRRVNEAIKIFSDGIRAHPRYAPLYRHRGHRYITLRQFDRAVTDLERAAELIEGRPDRIEPDGLPNPRNIPLTTTAFNVWYHLGLARYLRGEFEAALTAYEEATEAGRRYDDNLVDTLYWRYLILRRLGRHDDARALLDPVSAEMEMIENDTYHRLLRLYKGLIKPAQVLQGEEGALLNDATAGYGLGMWHPVKGRPDRAADVFRKVVATDIWPAFGFIAAEVELSRLARQDGRQNHAP